MRERLKELKNRRAGGLLPRLIYLVIRALRATMWVRIVGAEIPQAFHDRGVGVINVLWHARLLMVPFAYTGKGIRVLISSHGDGEIIANVMRCFRFGLVRGSSSKGGKEALREMVQLARDNQDLAITPDGRGGRPRWSSSAWPNWRALPGGRSYRSPSPARAGSAFPAGTGSCFRIRFHGG